MLNPNQCKNRRQAATALPGSHGAPESLYCCEIAGLRCRTRLLTCCDVGQAHTTICLSILSGRLSRSAHYYVTALHCSVRVSVQLKWAQLLHMVSSSPIPVARSSRNYDIACLTCGLRCSLPRKIACTNAFHAASQPCLPGQADHDGALVSASSGGYK